LLLENNVIKILQADIPPTDNDHLSLIFRKVNKKSHWSLVIGR
jgi:hypothetical protein